MPNGELVAAVEALLHGMGGLSHFERYRQDTALVRDIVVCTHGSRDVCCGRFGYQVYDILRRRYMVRGKIRVWRSSHIGGHRFAPTLIDYPEARYWGHLEPWAAEELASGPVSLTSAGSIAVGAACKAPSSRSRSARSSRVRAGRGRATSRRVGSWLRAGTGPRCASPTRARTGPSRVPKRPPWRPPASS